MSTVTRLKVNSTACRSAASQASLVSGASVVMTASIVAMFGAIMPLPLAMPPTVMRRPSTSSDRAVCLAKVSVVMIAVAASSPERLSRLVDRFGDRRVSFSMGSGTPMTPVEETMTSPVAQPSASAAARGHCKGVALTLGAGARVGVARVDHDCTSTPRPAM